MERLGIGLDYQCSPKLNLSVSPVDVMTTMLMQPSESPKITKHSSVPVALRNKQSFVSLALSPLFALLSFCLSLWSYVILISFPFFLSFLLGSGPEEVDDLCFLTYGEFSPPSPLSVHPSLRPTPPVSRPTSQSRDLDLGLVAQIISESLKS